MKPIISVENLGKQYRLGTRRASYSSLRETFAEAVRSPLKRLRRDGHSADEMVWALKDVSFEVRPGEVVGIIGRNGAGKSTLLKILSRITEPTTGKVQLYGRIASLLEVGTGFHPELTGRENIYLNGAILGMRREEITKKFDEIVAFAEIEKFLDTPVKHYSSGMYMRLAFAVAAHLEPEILVIDEVLAVGDTEFQKKCLGKMDEVSKTGRTVLFVSHQMGPVAQLCPKAILLEKGRVIMQDHANSVIEYYINQRKSKANSYESSSDNDKNMFIANAVIVSDENEVEGNFRHDEGINIKVGCKVNDWVRGAEVRMIIRDGRNINVFTADVELNTLSTSTKKFTTLFQIPANLLRPNTYSVTLALFIPHQYYIELLQDILFFTINDSGTKYAQSEGIDYGSIFSPCKTEIVDAVD
jgi:lipopolysaccharide transport system ATP-binding protein